MSAFDAVVLAGGAARRMGGVDKMLIEVDGVRLIDRALAAVAGAERVAVVGERRPRTVPATWVREQPPGGGPVAALAAGLAEVGQPTVVLLAADLPFVGAEHVRHLLHTLDDVTPSDVTPSDGVGGAADADGAMFVEASTGADQPLLSVWRSAALRRVLPAEPAGAALRRVLAPLRAIRVVGSEFLQDCDTASDVEAARRLVRGEMAP